MMTSPTTMTDRTAAERQRRKRERDREAGWVSVRVRVPAHRVEDLRTYAATLGKPTSKIEPPPRTGWVGEQQQLFPDYE